MVAKVGAPEGYRVARNIPPEAVDRAWTILRTRKGQGYEEEFDLGGKHYLGRIEPHFHTPNMGAPYGWHSGCTLYELKAPVLVTGDKPVGGDPKPRPKATAVTVPSPTRKYRVVTCASPQLVSKAWEILRRNSAGAKVYFELEGKQYLGQVTQGANGKKCCVLLAAQ